MQEVKSEATRELQTKEKRVQHLEKKVRIEERPKYSSSNICAGPTSTRRASS
jgi:hypothetical protein